MNFGKLTINKARKELVCKHCEGKIEIGEQYLGVQYIGVGTNKISFAIRNHLGCLADWCVSRQNERRQAIVDKDWSKTKKPGRPSLGLSKEDLRDRKYVQHRVWNKRKDLLAAYGSGDEEKIRYRWIALAYMLREYGEVNGSRYMLGEDITQYISRTLLYQQLIRVEGDPNSMAEAILDYWDKDREVKIRRHGGSKIRGDNIDRMVGLD